MRSNQVPLIMLGLLLVLVVGLAAQLTWDASRGSSASVAAVVPSPNHTAPRPQPSSKSQWDELAELQALEGFAPLMAAHACWIAAMRDRPVFTENPSQALESASPLLWVWPTDGTGTPLPLARNDTGPGFLLRNGEYAMQFDLERSQMGSFALGWALLAPFEQALEIGPLSDDPQLEFGKVGIAPVAGTIPPLVDRFAPVYFRSADGREAVVEFTWEGSRQSRGVKRTESPRDTDIGPSFIESYEGKGYPPIAVPYWFALQESVFTEYVQPVAVDSPPVSNISR